MTLVSMSVALQSKSEYLFSFADSRFAHAAVMRAITESNPIMGKTLHDHQGYKPVTVAILSPRRRSALLRLTFISSPGIEYANQLMTTWAKKPYIKVGGAQCEITNIDVNTMPWGKVESWSSLLGDRSGIDHVKLTFITPTAINKVNDQKVRFTGLLPDAPSVFLSLARKWSRFGGPDNPENLHTYLCTGGCVISSYRIATVAYDFSNYKQIGFVGTATYVCRKYDEECAGAIVSLTRFALYSGVGYHTAQGMGCVLPQTKKT